MFICSLEKSTSNVKWSPLFLWLLFNLYIFFSLPLFLLFFLVTYPSPVPPRKICLISLFRRDQSTMNVSLESFVFPPERPPLFWNYVLVHQSNFLDVHSTFLTSLTPLFSNVHLSLLLLALPSPWRSSTIPKAE